MLGKNVHFKGYLFKPELYPFDTKVVGKTPYLLFVDHPNGYPKEIDGVKRLVVQVRKEDLEIIQEYAPLGINVEIPPIKSNVKSI